MVARKGSVPVLKHGEKPRFGLSGFVRPSPRRSAAGIITAARIAQGSRIIGRVLGEREGSRVSLSSKRPRVGVVRSSSSSRVRTSRSSPQERK